ncbi:MAG: hypothetical protein ACRBCL_11575 [Maritimibacter sp.]
MKQALAMLVLVIIALGTGYLVFGYEAMLMIAYGAISIMAMMISATFLWLWFERTTPLALGMAYSWAGTGLITGWWWWVKLMGSPAWVRGHPGIFGVLGLCFVGAVLHFAVIHRSFGYHGAIFVWPIAVAIGLSAWIYVIL